MGWWFVIGFTTLTWTHFLGELGMLPPDHVKHDWRKKGGVVNVAMWSILVGTMIYIVFIQYPYIWLYMYIRLYRSNKIDRATSIYHWRLVPSSKLAEANLSCVHHFLGKPRIFNIFVYAYWTVAFDYHLSFFGRYVYIYTHLIYIYTFDK